MKSKLFILSVVLTMASTASAWTARSTVNGGEHGFNSTDAFVDNQGNKTIRCKDPGWTACPTSVNNPNEQGGMDYALGQIAAGVLSGTYSDPIGGTTTTWSSDNSRGDNSTILVQ